MVALLFLACFLSLPKKFRLEGVFNTLNSVHEFWEVYLCGVVGILALTVLSLFGEFATAKNSALIEVISNKCRKGPAAAITLGLAFGYIGSLVPALLVILTSFYGYSFLGFYGIAIAILGMISTFPIQLSLQSLSPLALTASTSVKVANLG